MVNSSENNCLFCKIGKKEIPSGIVYEDEYVLAFNDIRPVSPLHILIITKKHYENILDLGEEMKWIHRAIKVLAEERGIDKSGFRIVNNCGEDGGQEVPHVHFHMLAKRHHSWPPG